MSYSQKKAAIRNQKDVQKAVFYIIKIYMNTCSGKRMRESSDYCLVGIIYVNRKV